MEEQQELPQGWELATFKDVGIYINGRAFKPTEWEEKGRPILRIQNLTKSTGTVNRFSGDIEEKYIVRPGELLISWSATLGAFIYNGEEAVLNQHIFKVIPRIDKHFLFFGTENFIDDLKRQTQGSGMQHITKGKFEDTPFPVPPLPEQRRIVAKLEELFSKLDAGVAAVRRTQALLKRYRQSVLHAAVTGELTRAWREAHPAPAETGAALLERIRAERRAQWEAAQVAKRGGQLPLSAGWKSKYMEPEAPDTSELPELPEDWAVARLDMIASLKGGVTKDSKRQHVESRSVPYLRVANVQRGYLDLTEIKEIEASEEAIRDLALQYGDVLFNEGGDLDKLGRGWIWENQVPECIHQNHVFRARTYLPEMASRLISYWGNSFGQLYFMRVGKQTTNLASINLSKLSEFPVPLPPLAEQAEIVREVEARISTLDNLELTLTDELKRAERLRQSILHRAFTGRLVPQDATDEPAAALLARLRKTPAAPAKTKVGRGHKAVAQQTTLGL